MARISRSRMNKKIKPKQIIKRNPIMKKVLRISKINMILNLSILSYIAKPYVEILFKWFLSQVN